MRKILKLLKNLFNFLFPRRRKKFDYSKRYSSRWPLISKQAKLATKYHCCLCHKKTKQLEVHHAKYCNWLGFSIAGRERVGVDIFPLCLSCHYQAHNGLNYIKDKKNPVLRNRNTPQFYQVLTNNYYSLINKLKNSAKWRQ